ncbi:MAG TPA: Uma2 family endonuclease [Leptospiraceae bacterium]|nr:Uma2 family endonuclease [Leptospiraceae bacterium]HMW07514.1 Uma2 family endonuclease [Leptospiraceae bacterium]HMX35351.1 Uma2 family endonuclease [Leptospiraceae bacterium]HMY33092.1 Uma2 family endonuclease [Leptospiraceae bacterium]HMZ64218.1 Uma2 family endonuclease [Leptospiraceae bacterium]
MNTFVLEIPDSIGKIDDEKYLDLCKKNPESRIERSSKGEIIIMAPTGGETGRRNFELGIRFGEWNRKKKLGKFFDSSTAFKLPKGGIRSPDVGFVSNAKWNSISLEDKKKFPPLCPEFVLELLSDSDSIETSQKKMEEWMDNGCLLSWLIDLDEKKIYIYRKNKPVETLLGLDHILSGEDVLPEFTLDLKEIE